LTFDFLANDADFVDTALLWQDTQNSSGSAGVAQTSSNSPTAGAEGNGPVVSANSTSKLAPVFPRDIQVPADNQLASGLVVLCDDVQWSRTPLQYESEFDQDSMMYPMFGPLGSNIWECAFWPNAPISSPVKITANGPANILMLQNLRDPNTPYPGAVDMHKALGQRSRLVTVDGGGHAIYGLEPDSTCATDIATAYLAKGVFPDQDVFCSAPSAAAPSAALQGDARARLRKAVLRQLVRPTHSRK
jgi:pimeloyl-ACP methyl ester carboxylesterase